MFEEFTKRNYTVEENAAIYFTPDMDQTIQWFKDVLGWYGAIDARDENGKGVYGSVNHLPYEAEALKLASFSGFHLFLGAPNENLVGFILVNNLERVHELVKGSGWNQVTEIKVEPWGGKTCEVTTIDGCILRFFELSK